MTAACKILILIQEGHDITVHVRGNENYSKMIIDKIDDTWFLDHTDSQKDARKLIDELYNKEA